MSQPQAIELSRKEQDRLPRNAAVEATSEKAIATAAVQFNALSTYDKELDTSLTLCGKVALSLVSEADSLILPLPARVVRGDSSEGQIGFVLTLEDRAIVAWTEGTFRITYFAHTIPYSSVKTARHQLYTPGKHRYLGFVKVEAAEDWTFRLRAMFQNQSFVQSLASNFLGEDIENGATVEPATQAPK